ncbi:ABC transporter ATP-binding protein [Ruminiclostridium cellobioparum]|uniref:ABC-type multidrug transport system, ATPase component n=1 Tax=Ruminiclostridium cellobioparum subsp. termitidis CT1112 TaxID=1195236 RepID=S0FUM4_RUMCE|nr:ABC transporter ATP-binding protein [Ruminiclostridium cellobioparum]EMS72238.1 ABC-type multidrug transport system, ATPase component [Ruminiclostridium cellobioparum subsp. termitidis CT1112]
MLRIENLCKSYGKFRAVNDLNLHIPKGEIFGFVGPNGAGKTTTMRIICGLLDATSGKVYADGIDVIDRPKELKRKIGYMPDFFGVYDDLKVMEYLEFYASIYNIKGADSRKICQDLLELVDLTDKKDFYVDSLSRGMKQRLCLARSLVHNPELLILDEPASGMDPRARIEMKEILRTLKSMGKTILVSSHILPELAELCTAIGIIEKGRIVMSGTVDEITRKVYHTQTIRIKVIDRLEEAIRVLQEYPDIDGINPVGDNEVEASFNGDEVFMNALLVRLIQNNIPVTAFNQLDGNLEDIFMKVTATGEVEQ